MSSNRQLGVREMTDVYMNSMDLADILIPQVYIFYCCVMCMTYLYINGGNLPPFTMIPSVHFIPMFANEGKGNSLLIGLIDLNTFMDIHVQCVHVSETNMKNLIPL